MEAIIALAVIAFLVIVVLAKSVTIVPQAQAKVVERLLDFSPPRWLGHSEIAFG